MVPDPPATFPAFVRHCREDRCGETKVAFAERFDGRISAQQIGKWEHGDIRTAPRHDALAKLAEVCNSTPGEIGELLGLFGVPATAKRPIERDDDSAALRDLIKHARPLSAKHLRLLTALARELVRQ